MVPRVSPACRVASVADFRRGVCAEHAVEDVADAAAVDRAACTGRRTAQHLAEDVTQSAACAAGHLTRATGSAEDLAEDVAKPAGPAARRACAG